MSENLNLERWDIPRKKPDVKSITSLAAVAALAMGTLAGCGQKNDVEAAPEPVEVTQSESEILEEAEVVRPEKDEMPKVEIDYEAYVYETRFPDPIVDGSLLEGFSDVGNEFSKFQHIQPFFEVNGISSLTTEELQGEGYAQRILNNWQQRSFLVNDTFNAGYHEFAQNMAEYGLFGTDVQWVDPSLRDTSGDNILFPHEILPSIGTSHENGPGGEEGALPMFSFDKLTGHTDTGNESIFNSYTKGIIIEASGFDPAFNIPSTDQLVFELVNVGGGSYAPRLLYFKEKTHVTGSLDGNLGGYDYPILFVFPDQQDFTQY